MSDVSMPIAAVELQEYLFSKTLSASAKNKSEVDMQYEIRKAFRFQRFAVMNWLLMNGVSIPARLLTDDAHPDVGGQWPDSSSMYPFSEVPGVDT